MKKIFYLLSMVMLFAVACEKDNTNNEEQIVSPTSLEYASVTIADHNAVVIKPEGIAPNAPVVVVATKDLELKTRAAEQLDINFKAAEHCLIGKYILCIVEVGNEADASFLAEVKNSFASATKAYLLSYRTEFAYTAAMQIPDTFNAYACVSATMNAKTYAANNFTKPVSFVHVHATENSLYKWYGVEPNYVAVPLCVGALVAINECTHYTSGELLPRDGMGLVSYTKYLGGKDGHEVVLYSVDGANEGWCDAEFEVYNQIWNFFKNH
ncbi:MAG: hypothetical protein IJW88_06585 [Alistipes sp.]|nr:hypothetical protein [Alistipes sp.]